MTLKGAASSNRVAVGLGVAWLLVLLTIWRYPGTGTARQSHILAVLLATGLLVASAALAILLERRANNEVGRLPGARTGLVAGCLWVLEISFNNFVAPGISTGRARFVVDNSTWAMVAVLLLAVSMAASWKARRFGAGVVAGAWSGLVSGLAACLMALLLVVAWMPLLLRDPLNAQEWAARGAEAQASGMAEYFAYETMAGALGHLTVLGVGMGALLGCLGGIAGIWRRASGASA